MIGRYTTRATSHSILILYLNLIIIYVLCRTLHHVLDRLYCQQFQINHVDFFIMMKIIHDPSIDFIVVNPSEKGVPLPEIHLVHGDHVLLGSIPPM